MRHADHITRNSMVPMIVRYHSGDRKGAAALFAERPDLLAWAREEIQRLSVPIMRGLPSQPDPVSLVHKAALERMVAEYEQGTTE